MARLACWCLGAWFSKCSFHTCRFQYITFVSFLAQGVCPGKENTSRAKEYEQLYFEYGWDDFYRHSSRRLNTPVSTEACFCEVQSVHRNEARAFTYWDEQVRC
jgi:hypothetical protein